MAKKNKNISNRNRGMWNAARGIVTGESQNVIASYIGVPVNQSFRQMVKEARDSGEGSLKVRSMLSEWMRREGHVSEATKRRHERAAAKGKSNRSKPRKSLGKPKKSVVSTDSGSVEGTTEEIVALVATAQGISVSDLTDRILDAWASRQETRAAAEAAREAAAAEAEASEAAEAAIAL